jgi:uncharacterized protein YjiS (DUF1127 family)
MKKTHDDHDKSILRRLAARWRAHRLSRLAELDARALADIGIDRSEFASIEAEARGDTLRTRLRIVEGMAGA